MLNWWLDAALMLTGVGPLNAITIISFLLFIVLILVEFYIFYKFVFSYMELTLAGEKKDISKLVKTSLKNTKWWKKFISFVKVFFVAWLLYLPIFAVIADLNTKTWDLELYRAYLGAPLEAQAQFEELNPYAIQYLILNYGNKTLGQVEADIWNYNLMWGILWVIMFLVIDGVFFMALSSVYFNKLKE
jgi:hypothetical protein